MDKWKKIQVITIFLGCLVHFSCANCLGASGQHYADGSEGFFCGYLPEPGLYLVNYTYLYTSSSYKNHRGKKSEGLDFHLNVFAVAPRFLYFFEKKLFGARYGVYIAQPFYYTDLKLKKEGVMLVDDWDRSLGDTIFSPLILGNHHGFFHWIFSFDMVAPTGHYKGKELVTTIVSKNYWSFQPNIAITLLLPQGIDVSAKFLWEFHTKNSKYYLFNRKVTYAPGSTFHTDYAIGIPLSENFRFGINGFFYQQLANDEINGLEVKDSKASGFAIGPAFEITYKKLIVSFKEQFEITAKNSSKGNVTWLNIYYDF